MVELRCKYCNWLNKEVQEEFICKGCKRENIIRAKVEEPVDENKFQSKSNRR